MMQLVLIQKTYKYFELVFSYEINNYDERMKFSCVVQQEEKEDTIRNPQKVASSLSSKLNSLLDTALEKVMPVTLVLATITLLIYSLFFDKG